MDIILGDFPLITEETFDFEPSSPLDSSSNEDAVTPVLRNSPCLVTQPLALNIPSSGDGSLILKWSPLSAQGMEEITKEANRLARELEKENMETHQLHTMDVSHKNQRALSSCSRLEMASVDISPSNGSISSQMKTDIFLHPPGTLAEKNMHDVLQLKSIDMSPRHKIEGTNSIGLQSDGVVPSAQAPTSMQMSPGHQLEDLSSQLKLNDIHSQCYSGKQQLTGTEATTTFPTQLYSVDCSMPGVISSPGYHAHLLSDNKVSPRSPRRETYVIRDSPVRNLLPNIDFKASLTTVPCKSVSPGKRGNRESGTPEKRKRGNGIIMRASAPPLSPGKQSQGKAHNVRPSQVDLKPLGKFSSGKGPAHLPSSVRPTGIPAPSSRLPVPKSMEHRIPVSANPTKLRDQAGPARTSAQRGSLLKPQSRLVAPKKTSLLGPLR